jgi:hypothetical protein
VHVHLLHHKDKPSPISPLELELEAVEN